MTENPGTPPSGGPQQSSWGTNPSPYGSPMQAPPPQPNMLLALLAGFMASILGAVIWCGITYATHRQFGLVAIGIGFLVGYAVRYFGHGASITYGIIGGVFALLGCVMGNILTILAFAAIQEGVPFTTIILAFLANPLIIFMLLQETFSFIDIVFYGIAIYEGFRFSMADAPPSASEKPVSLGLNDPQPAQPQVSHAPPPPPPPSTPSAPEPVDEEEMKPDPIRGGL
jgi:hypothetical protein